MSRVSYQIDLGTAPAPPAAYTPLDPDAIQTRAKDGTVSIAVTLSKRQARWLRRVATAGGADSGAVVRALVDLGMELEIDWEATARPADVRNAVRDAVLLRRHG